MTQMMDETASAKREHPTFTLDLDQSLRLEIPSDAKLLTPQPFTAPDGRSGWSVRFPQGRPIATPAYDDGLLFVGGGYGSHEFYALDAATGQVAWDLHTSDDGPTAAVVEEGLVAFNTESCTVVVCEAKTGRVVWQEWLGDPLMSQPAIWAGRLFMAYPANSRKPLTGQAKWASPLVLPRAGHRLLCAELRTGRHLWQQDLTADVMTAPVISDGRVYVTCLDGTSFCFEAENGALLWTKNDRATCAPLVVQAEVVVTEKQGEADRPYEGLRRKCRNSGGNLDERCWALGESPYLARNCGGGSGLSGGLCAALDTSVGFSKAPGAARLDAANDHVGLWSVSGAWAYQGSRPAFANSRLYNVRGRTVYCVDHATGAYCWETEAAGFGVDARQQMFLPPAMGREYIYLCSRLGHVVALDQRHGRAGLMYATGRGMSFQTCLAAGRIYAGTAQGELICLDTGGDDADGWPMWGGNAQHNRVG